MPDTLIAGDTGVIPQGLAFSFAPRTGLTPGNVSIGHYITMLGVSAALIKANVPHEYRQEGMTATVTVTGGPMPDRAEAPQDSWQLLENEVHKDIFEAPNSLKIEAAQIGSLGYIRRDLALYNQGLPPAPGVSYPAGVQPLVNQLFALLARGTTHFPVIQPVLRHSQICSDAYSGSGIEFSNLGKVYSPTKLLAEVGAFPTPPPKPILDAIAAFPAPADQPNYFWGWRKTGVNYATAARYKVEINFEYHLDQWPVFTFDTNP